MSPVDKRPGQAASDRPPLTVVPDADDDLLDDDSADDELTDEEYEAFEGYSAAQDVLDAWLDAGWLRILPSLVVHVLDAVDAPLTTREEVSAIVADLAADTGRLLLDDDPLWPVATEIAYRTADLDIEYETELDPAFDPDEYQPDPDQPTYDDYLADVRAARTEWGELLQRHDEPSVQTAEDLLALLGRWGLATLGDEAVEFVADPPDPVGNLPLSEGALADILTDQLDAEVDAVYDELHDFFFHTADTELTVRLGQLAERAETGVPEVRLALALLLNDPESGLTAHRRDPKGDRQLTADDLEALAEHARFVLRVDRQATGFPQHDH